jgi:uncharacterized membrane protein HdeD (DUF308 family)
VTPPGRLPGIVLGAGGEKEALMATVAYTREDVEHASRKWWVLLLTGIAWILISLVVLDADLDSAVTIAYVLGGFLLAVGVLEFVMVAIVDGWKWLHVLMGVLFVLGGFAAFMEPFQTFGMLSALIGFFLVVKGTVDFTVALVTRHEVDLWWLLLISGIIEILLGFWASGYPGRSAALLVVWIGFGALMRGITQLITAFQVRKIHEEVS